MLDFKTFILMVLLVATAACVKQPASDEVASSAKWGHLDYYAPISLFNVQKGGTVQICSDSPKLDGVVVEAALRDWFRAIGRADDVRFLLSCKDASKAKALVNAFLNPNQARKKTCDTLGDVIGYAEPHKNGQFGGTIVRCMRNVGLSQMLSHTLHETGHLVGMCDGYSQDDDGKLVSAVGMHRRCSKKYRSKTAGISVMNAGFAEVPQLTPDDAIGAVEFANRPDLLSKGDWPVAQLSQVFVHAQANAQAKSKEPQRQTAKSQKNNKKTASPPRTRR